MSMTDQLVIIRVHWLPLFYDNRIINTMLSDCGEIQNIRFCKSFHANFVAMNTKRQAVINTNEIKKQQIPYLINVARTAALVSKVQASWTHKEGLQTSQNICYGSI